MASDMTNGDIRLSRPDDLPHLAALYPLAFPDEDLLEILHALLARDDMISLVAVKDSDVVGHIVFAPCSLADKSAKLALLGPLAVHPDHQKIGLGSALIRDGFKRLTEERYAKVLVLGDPRYYGRFGFEAEATIQPPYALSAEWDGAWQGLSLARDEEEFSGTLIVPEPWQNAALWAD